jgi:hypothetical protein
MLLHLQHSPFAATSHVGRLPVLSDHSSAHLISITTLTAYSPRRLQRLSRVCAARKSKMTRSDLIDRISFLYPGISEVFSLGLGVIIGAALFSAIQRATHTHTRLRQSRRDVESTLRNYPDERISQSATEKAIAVNPSTISPPSTIAASSLTREPHSIQNLPTPSSQLADLPLPLRTTIHQPHDSARPWTSSDLIEQSRLARANHRSPWKRHTLPAMHVTDHVHYYPSRPTIDQSPDFNLQSAGYSEAPQRQWCRRRVLTFQPLLSSARSAQSTGRLESDSHGIQAPGAPVGMEAPITGLQIEIEQRGVALPDDAERDKRHRP